MMRFGRIGHAIGRPAVETLSGGIVPGKLHFRRPARSNRRACSRFSADNPGMTLFHCHQQLHMDFGFMTLFDYV